jgi:hypothetical protein
MGRLTNKTALVTGGSSDIGSSKLEIRDAREADLPAMVKVTQASYAEFQESSPSGFWDLYMTNVEEAIMRASNTERIAAFLDGELVASVLLCHKSFKGDDPEIRLLAVLPLEALRLASPAMTFGRIMIMGSQQPANPYRRR